MLYSGRGSDHLDRVPNAVKEWKKQKGKQARVEYWVLQ